MTFCRSAAVSATALTVFLGGTAAQADVTPAQVWADWTSYMAGFGYEMSGTEAASGNDLTITDMTFSMPIPEEDVTIGMTLGQVMLKDNGDGTVSIEMPASNPLTVNIGPEGQGVTVNMNYNTTGYSMVVSGEEGDMTYTYSAAELGLELADLVVEGQSVPIGTASMAIANVAGSSTSKMGDLRMASQSFKSGAVSYDLNFSDPTGSGTFVLKGGTESMEFGGNAAMPAEMDMNDMAAMIAAGFAVDGMYKFGPGQTEFMFSEGEETVQATSSSQGGALAVALDQSQLMYDIQSNGMQMQMSGAEIPLPVELSMEQMVLRLLMPLTAGEEEQDFGLKILMGGLQTSEMLWGLADMMGQLPHDPITISMDLSGKARLFLDLLDPASMEALDNGSAIPGEVTAINLNELIVSAVGAELTGNGAFTIDNTDMATFGGMPAPNGSVDLKLVGGNGLLDNLVAMGLIPEDQAMGARMMSGMFAVAGDGEDTLVSKIEVNADGSIMANGQRVK